MIYVKQYGLKRSGTNAARWLLEANFRDVRVLADVLGWKHGPPSLTPTFDPKEWYPEHEKPIVDPLPPGMIADVKEAVDRGELRYHLLVKNPYAWIVSSLRWRGPGIKESSDTLVRQRMKVWVERGWQYLSFRKQVSGRGVLCVISDSMQLYHELPALGETFKLERKHDRWMKSSRAFKPTGDLCEGDHMMARSPYNEEYYLRRQYLNDIPPRAMKWINDELDGDLLRLLLMEPAESCK